MKFMNGYVAAVYIIICSFTARDINNVQIHENLINTANNTKAH